jgi:OOP family OmpA-OmpF porin
MKAIFLSLLVLSLSLHASEEFPLIEPYSVENAPVVVIVEPEPIPEPEPIKEEVVAEETNAVEERKDSDSDDVFDDEDQCPGTEIGIEVDETGCEKDDDEDGVVNSKDNCPDTSKEFMVDGYGCPQTAILKINFPSGKAHVTKDLIKALEDFAKFLQDNIGYQVIIYGHTDSTGGEDHNKILSQQRADVVKEALVRYDINEIRLTAIGKGESEPMADNATKEGRAENRRIEVELLQ